MYFGTVHKQWSFGVLNGKRQCFDVIHLRERKETANIMESDILILSGKCASFQCIINSFNDKDWFSTCHV